MKLATRCPSCNTAFRVAPERLIPTRGQVRCGVCQHVFNAYDFLVTITAVSPDAATLMAAQPTITANERSQPDLPKNTVIPPDRPLTSQQKELLALIDAAQAQQDEADRLAKQAKEKTVTDASNVSANVAGSEPSLETTSLPADKNNQNTVVTDSNILSYPPKSSIDSTLDEVKSSASFTQNIEVNIADDIAKSLSNIAIPDIVISPKPVNQPPIVAKTAESIPVIALRSELDAEAEQSVVQSANVVDSNISDSLKLDVKKDITVDVKEDAVAQTTSDKTKQKLSSQSNLAGSNSAETDSATLSALLNTISDISVTETKKSEESPIDSPVLTLPPDLLSASSKSLLSDASVVNQTTDTAAPDLPRLMVDSPILADSPLAAIKQLSGSDVPIKPLDTSDEALKKALERTKKRTARKLASAKAEKAKRASEQEKLGLKPGLVDEITRLLEDEPHESEAAQQTGLEHLVLPAPAEPPEFVKASLAKQRKKRIFLITGVAVASVLLIAQFLYTWRDDIAARRESLRPSMELFCKMFFCEVRAPHHIDQWEIIGHKVKIPFDIKTQQAMTDVYAFEVTLKNKSRLPLALPHLEFSLLDDKNQLISRRVVKPEDYLRLAGRSNEEVAQILKYGWREEEYTANLWIRVKGGSFTNYKVGHFYP